jgi:hypothetical protein
MMSILLDERLAKSLCFSVPVGHEIKVFSSSSRKLDQLGVFEGKAACAK